MHSPKPPPGNVKIPRRTSSGRNADSIELRSYLLDTDVIAHEDASAEPNALRLELRKPEIEHRLLELELRYPVPKQSPNPLVLFEDHDVVPETTQLLRGSETSGS